jgi:hypothetical protein
VPSPTMMSQQRWTVFTSGTRPLSRSRTPAAPRAVGPRSGRPRR